MQYAYLKSRPLNEEERRRLRISVGTALRLKGAITRPCRNRISSQLAAFLDKPSDGVKNELLSWLLSYGSPQLLDILLDSLAAHGTRRRELAAFSQAGSRHLLPREYITPDFQRVQNAAQPQTALVCFTGDSLRLNMPVQLFHSHVAGRFDLILYLRDAEKQLFTRGIQGMAASMDELFAELRRHIPAGCHLAVLSASSGGYAAARFAEAAGARRLAMFSPPLKFRDVAAVSGPARMPPSDARIFFARTNEGDVRFASDWAGTGYADAIRWFDTSSHGTLKYLFAQGESQSLVDWLRGGADAIPYRKLGRRRSTTLRTAFSRLLRFAIRN